MKLRHNLKGEKFGRWLVLRRDGRRTDRPFWICVCECGKEKSIESLQLRSGKSGGCKGCAVRQRCVTHGLCKTKRYGLYHNAFQRAKIDKVPFDIRPIDVPEIPEKCPLLGLVLVQDNTKCLPNSPTLDRIIPELGYVKDNIWIISHKANTIKSNASVDELLTLVKNFTAVQIERINLELDKARGT